MISYFFFNDTATTEIYTLSLHDALPISAAVDAVSEGNFGKMAALRGTRIELVPLDEALAEPKLDRKSTRLNSSHANISYAVFCLKKNKKVREATSGIVMSFRQRVRPRPR